MTKLRIVPAKQAAVLQIQTNSINPEETRRRYRAIVIVKQRTAKISIDEAVMASPEMGPSIKKDVATYVVIAVEAILVKRARVVTE